MTKRELIEELESVATSGGSGSFYKILNIVQEYGDSDMEDYLWEDVITDNSLDEMVKTEAEGGAQRVYYFLKDIEWWDDAYRVNGYGKIENLDDGYLSGVVSDLLRMAEDLEDDEEDEEEEDDDKEKASEN